MEAPPPAAAVACYRVVCKAVVRSGVAMDSEKIGVLEPGEVVAVAGRVGGRLERRVGGWVSETASDGTVLLEKSKPPVRTDAKMPLLKGAAVYTCSARPTVDDTAVLKALVWWCSPALS